MKLLTVNYKITKLHLIIPNEVAYTKTIFQYYWLQNKFATCGNAP